MNANEIKVEIEKVERAIFFEQMADFMNWGTYYKLCDKERKLKEMLKEAEK